MLTIQNVLRVLRYSLIGIPFLYYGVKEFVRDYQINKSIDIETYIDSGTIKSISIADPVVAGNGVAAMQERITFELTNNKSFYSHKLTPIFLHADFDTTKFNGGQKAIFRVSRNRIRYGVPQFVALTVDGKELLSTEEGDAKYKKSEYKYFLLIFGLFLAISAILAIHFMAKEKQKKSA